MDRSAALRPLIEAAGPIRLLEEYSSDAELNAAILDVATAVEDALRFALRTDPEAPEEHRLSALSPQVLSLDDVVRSLRSRDRISLETAGGIHALAGAVARAGAGEARAADADLALVAVAGLRDEFTVPAPVDPVPTPGDSVPGPRSISEAGGGAGAGARTETTRASRPRALLRGEGRWMAWVAVGFAVLFVLGLAWVLAGGGEDHYREGIIAFRAERWDSAAVAFERVLADRPVDVGAMLYLSRVYRRQGRLPEAAEVLREAVRVASDDADVRRELGHLFMDLEQPRSAVQQYERALEYDPDSPLNWAGLLRALRAMDDPRGDRLLEGAPPRVREALEREIRG